MFMYFFSWDGFTKINPKNPDPSTPHDRVGCFGFQSHPKRVGFEA